MKTVGIREVRQRLSELLLDVAAGREIVVTDRGRPVARLVPPGPDTPPFPDHSAMLRSRPRATVAVSNAIIEDRADRF